MSDIIETIGNANMDDPQSVGEAYYNLYQLKKTIESKMEPLKKKLIEHGQDVYFSDVGQKIQYIDGKEKSYVDAHKVFELLNNDPEEFLKVAKVGESDIKKAFSKQEANSIVGQAKIIEGKSDPSIKMTKMTEQELKEHNEGG